jgi:hypothetical protein
MSRPDWLPRKREEEIAMSKNWQTLFTSKATAWNIPTADVNALKTLTTTAAEAALALAQSSARTVVATAQAKTAFAALADKMRFLKNRYFVSPPLVDADFISLGLKPHDTKLTPIPPPVTQAEADITYPAAHVLELHLRPVADSTPDPQRLRFSNLFRHSAARRRERGSGHQSQTGVDEAARERRRITPLPLHASQARTDGFFTGRTRQDDLREPLKTLVSFKAPRIATLFQKQCLYKSTCYSLSFC